VDEVINPGYHWNVGLTILPSVLKSIPVNEGHALALRHSTLLSGSIIVQNSLSRNPGSPQLKLTLFSVPSSPTHRGVSDEPLSSLRIGIVHDTEFAEG
jgi:hypothetical protein